MSCTLWSTSGATCAKGRSRAITVSGSSELTTAISCAKSNLGSVGAVLAEQVGDAMLGKRTRIDDAEIDRALSKPATKVLQVERHLREMLARCHERLQASIEELGLTPGRVERVVATALELARQPPLQPTVSRGEFRLPPLG